MNKLKKQGSNICFGAIVLILALMPVFLNAGLLSGASTILFLGKRSEERRVGKEC